VNLHAVRKGSLKCVSEHSFVRRFVLPGDVADLDGLGVGAHSCEAIALEATEVCQVPCWRANLLADANPAVAAHLRALVSVEILRAAEHARLLSRHGARERVAGFLAHLAERQAARGKSATKLRLAMTRRDIGAHLGITLESVSRALSGLQADGRLTVDGRRIALLDKAFFASAA
jgi:CRP/FNR family transcriptional regulator